MVSVCGTIGAIELYKSYIDDRLDIGAVNASKLSDTRIENEDIDGNGRLESIMKFTAPNGGKFYQEFVQQRDGSFRFVGKVEPYKF